LQEDPEVTDFKNAAADTAHDVKESVKPNEKAASKDSSDKSVLESVSVPAKPLLLCFSLLTTSCSILTTL